MKNITELTSRDGRTIETFETMGEENFIVTLKVETIIRPVYFEKYITNQNGDILGYID